jgi:hypothetical protein
MNRGLDDTVSGSNPRNHVAGLVLLDSVQPAPPLWKRGWPPELRPASPVLDEV